MRPHPHASAIKAWADGRPIQYRYPGGTWHPFKIDDVAAFFPNIEYRIAPEAEDQILFRLAYIDKAHRPSIIVVPVERYSEVERSPAFVEWITDTLTYTHHRGLIS